MSIKWSNHALQVLYQNGFTVGVPALRMRLYTALAGALNSNTVIGSFTQATFAGYAAVVLGAQPAGASSLDFFGGAYPPAVFTPGVLGAPQTILGYYLDDNGANYMGGEAFAIALPLAAGANPPFQVVLTIAEENF